MFGIMTKPTIDWFFFQQSFDSLDTDTLRVKNYIRKVIELQNNNPIIKLPSVIALKDFFCVDANSITQCLFELKKEGFDFHVFNHEESIIIWNSLVNTKV